MNQPLRENNLLNLRYKKFI